MAEAHFSRKKEAGWDGYQDQEYGYEKDRVFHIEMNLFLSYNTYRKKLCKESYERKNGMKQTFSIQQIAQMSGLTTRTLRNYIRAGMLTGVKENGVWRFKPDDVDAFLENPNVFPSVQAKRNGMVFDFLRNRNHVENQMCVILDLPEENGKTVSDYFLTQFNTGNYGASLQFSYEDIRAYPRVIVKGTPEDVMKLLTNYRFERGAEENRHEI